MCLDYVDPEIKKTKGYGWKMFQEFFEVGNLYTPCYPWISEQEKLPINEWITDKKAGLVNGGAYQTGFHIFTTKKGAKSWGIGSTMRKVLYEDVVASGTQGKKHAIVARKIFIEDKS